MTAAPQEAPRLCGDWIKLDWISIVDGFCVSSKEEGRQGGTGSEKLAEESEDEQGKVSERMVEVGHL